MVQSDGIGANETESSRERTIKYLDSLGYSIVNIKPGLANGIFDFDIEFYLGNVMEDGSCSICSYLHDLSTIDPKLELIKNLSNKKIPYSEQTSKDITKSILEMKIKEMTKVLAKL